MPSSTSSSRRRRRPLAQLLFGVWAGAALALVVYLVSTPAAMQMDVVSHRLPDDPASFYLAHDRGGHVDHHVLYHGIDRETTRRMRQAEVLFLGNSRLMFALDQATLRGYLGPLDQDFFVLGFGHEEQDTFPEAILRRHDLRPSVVVVNVDGFFADDLSPWAARVVEESAFDAWKLQFEAELAHRVRRVVHRIVPHYVDLRRGQREFVIYRSREDGTWFVGTDFGSGTTFDWPPDDRHVPAAPSLRAAESFRREVEARGARLVLTVIPAPDVSLHRARALAAHLGLPLLVPDAGELQTIDGSHLSEDSSTRVSVSLLEQLRHHLDPP